MKKPDGNTGRTLSPETRAKISNARRGIPRTDAAKAAISAGKMGKKRSEQECAAISQGLRAYYAKRRDEQPPQA